MESAKFIGYTEFIKGSVLFPKGAHAYTYAYGTAGERQTETERHRDTAEPYAMSGVRTPCPSYLGVSHQTGLIPKTLSTSV